MGLWAPEIFAAGFSREAYLCHPVVVPNPTPGKTETLTVRGLVAPVKWNFESFS